MCLSGLHFKNLAGKFSICVGWDSTNNSRLTADYPKVQVDVEKFAEKSIIYRTTINTEYLYRTLHVFLGATQSLPYVILTHARTVLIIYLW